jgi:hypothetical protein
MRVALERPIKKLALLIAEATRVVAYIGYQDQWKQE